MLQTEEPKYYDRMRFFRRPRASVLGELRHGVWAMEGNRIGLFFHGDRNEMQASRYVGSELAAWTKPGGFIDVEEISPQEALYELFNWPEGQAQLVRMFNAHIERVTEELNQCHQISGSGQ